MCHLSKTQTRESWPREVKWLVQTNTTWASQVAQWWRICLPMQKRWVQSLGQEDPLEEEMAAHPSTLAWRTPWTEEPGGYSPRGGRVRCDWVTNTHTHMRTSHSTACSCCCYPLETANSKTDLPSVHLSWSHSSHIIVISFTVWFPRSKIRNERDAARSWLQETKSKKWIMSRRKQYKLLKRNLV